MLWQVCAERLKGSGKRLIAGTGAESTAETIQFTLKAAESGAEAAWFSRPISTSHLLPLMC